MLLEKVRKNFRDNDLVGAGQKVVVAVSGGVDSVALAHILHALGQRLEFRLHVASLNHGIRGEDAEEDVRFVAGLARQWRLPYTSGVADVPQLAQQNGMGIEEAGRRARYNFLARVAANTGAHCVAVGHHALDQAETLLMHIVRGSGLSGLRGMQFSSLMPGHPTMRLIRPLLNITRAELEQYCHEQRLPFRQDESNDDLALQRNFIRHSLLHPLLKRNPNTLTSFLRLADSAAIDEDFLASRFESEVLPQVEATDEHWRIAISDFERLHPAMKRRILRAAFERLAGDNAVLDHDLTAALLVFCEEAKVGKRRDLGAGVKLRIGYQTLSVERANKQVACNSSCLIPAETAVELTAPSCFELVDIRVELQSETAPATGKEILFLPTDVNMQLRTRRAGDRFRPKGMHGQSRKLKDWMIDRKIAREIRDQIPLICADGEIVAICCNGTWHLADLSRFQLIAEHTLTVVLG